MSSFFELFKKQGGMKIVKEYWRSGILFYVILQILLIGRNKKSLEIVRLCAQHKIFIKLFRTFSPVLQKFDEDYTNNKERVLSVPSNKVWVCWLQGLESAPLLVQRCYKSLQDHLCDREIILITYQNLNTYIDFPDYIIEKYNKGFISHAHFADLIRVELLCKYGGTWIDATVFCSGRNIPAYMLDSELFVFQKLKPGLDGSVCNASNWFITSWTNNKILLAQKELLLVYWKKYDYPMEYFFYHYLFAIVCNYYSNDWKKCIQFPNSFPHILLLMLFDPFDQKKWDAVINSCPFHKLAYKRTEDEMSKEGTFYRYIVSH